MANSEHLEILLKGKDVWNEWRKSNPDIIPDLTEADLSNRDFSSQIPIKNVFKKRAKELQKHHFKMPAESKDGDYIDLIVESAKFNGYNLSNSRLNGTNLSGANLNGANLAHALLGRANLKKATLLQANLYHINAENAIFTGAILDETNMAEAVLCNAKFEHASLMYANLQKADLSHANFASANLRDALLISTTFRHAFFMSADLRKATLWSSNLEKADLMRVDLRGTDLRTANLDFANIYAVRYNRWTLCRGIRISTAYGSPTFKRVAQDHDFLEEFRSSKLRYPIYVIWLIFADCGRSFSLWAAWSILAAIGFGMKFYSLGAEAFDLDHLQWSYSSLIYYSVITFTTLGFGDIVPKTPEASFWVMFEVILGYVMLGGLISILATKLARRS
ncbi:pentapeptide repeat-containing protein [candidate division KSB1 bacterium]